MMTDDQRTPRQIAELIVNNIKSQHERRRAGRPQTSDDALDHWWPLGKAVLRWQDTLARIPNGPEKISPRTLAKLILDFQRPLSLELKQAEIEALQAAGDAWDDQSVPEQHVEWIRSLAQTVHAEADRRYEPM